MTGEGFADADAPSDYCGHDPALVRPRAATGEIAAAGVGAWP
jgi:hypothetical protein